MDLGYGSAALSLPLSLVLGLESAALGPWFVPLGPGSAAFGPVALAALVLSLALVLLYAFLWPHVFYMLLLSMLKIYMLYIHRVVGPPFHLEVRGVSFRLDAYLCAFYLSDVYYMCFLRWFQTDILGI